MMVGLVPIRNVFTKMFFINITDFKKFRRLCRFNNSAANNATEMEGENSDANLISDTEANDATEMEGGY